MLLEQHYFVMIFPMGVARASNKKILPKANSNSHWNDHPTFGTPSKWPFQMAYTWGLLQGGPLLVINGGYNPYK